LFCVRGMVGDCGDDAKFDAGSYDGPNEKIKSLPTPFGLGGGGWVLLPPGARTRVLASGIPEVVEGQGDGWVAWSLNLALVKVVGASG